MTAKTLGPSEIENLARVHDIFRIQCTLDGAHHRDRTGAGLVQQEIHFVQAHAMLAAAVEVRIKKRVKRAGRMEDMGEVSIQFGSLDELNGLVDKLMRVASR